MVHYLHKTEPMKHQEEAFFFGYGKDYFALFAQQGTGKTKMLIDIASNLWNEHKLDAVIVIAPIGVQRQWATKELPKHSPVPFSAFVYRSATTKKYAREFAQFDDTPRSCGLKWFCVNIDVFSSDRHLDVFRAFITKRVTMVAIDESCSIKNPTANRTANIIQGLSTVLKSGKRVVSVKPLSAYRVIMTGTPTTNSPFDLYAPFEFLKPGFWRMTYSSFKSRYGLLCEDHVSAITRGDGREVPSRDFKRALTYGEIGNIRAMASRGVKESVTCTEYNIALPDYRYIVAHSDCIVPYKNLVELKQTMAPFAFIKTKKECLDLPEKVYSTIEVTMSDEQTAVYDEATEELEATYMGKNLDIATKLSLLTRLSQIAGGFFPYKDEDSGLMKIVEIGQPNPKIKALIADMEVGERPVIVACRFRAEAAAIAEAVRKAFPDETVECIVGGITDKEKGRITDAFAVGSIQVLVATLHTIHRGFNFQEFCYTMILYSNDYSLETRDQLEDRIHRNGQKVMCNYRDIVAVGTIDEKVTAVLQDKRNLLDYIREKDIREFFR